MADKTIKGKFQIGIILKEYVDTGDSIELQEIGNYWESCWGWKDVRKTFAFFIERMEEKLNGG